MDIVIISEFCEDFSKSDNCRFLYLAKMLADHNEVELITSSFRHTTKSRRIRPAQQWPFKIIFAHEPGYLKNVCIKRFYSHYIWGKNVEKYIRKRKKPDVIYCAVPSLTGPNRVAKYCQKNKIRFVVDVQDLWPEAFRMVAPIPVLADCLFLPIKKLANSIYKRADAICAVSDTYCKRALNVSRKCKKGTTVFLGTELAAFDRYASDNPILVKETDEIWIGYVGTLGASYDLICVMDAVKMIKTPVRFVVMGDGPRKKEFVDYAKKKEIKASFTGRLPYDQMCSLVSHCDIMVNPIAHMAAQSIINKHADYAASGLPVVSTQESDEYKRLINEYQMGFTCKNHDSNDLAQKLQLLIDDTKLRYQMGRNARKCAEEKFDRKKIYQLLKDCVLADRGGYCGIVKKSGEIWIGYAGTLGTSYDLRIVFKALRQIQKDGLKFIIIGDGPKRKDFQNCAKGMLNVIFLGRLSYEKMCGVLSACDIVVNPIVRKSAATVINKHADYAASGKPVLNTQRSKEYRRLIKEYQMGISCDSSEDLAENIEKLMRDQQLRITMGNNARCCAHDKFDRCNTYQMLEHVIIQGK